MVNSLQQCPDSKVHGANMGPIWGRQDPGGTYVGPMNFAMWVGPEVVLCGYTTIIFVQNMYKEHPNSW